MNLIRSIRNLGFFAGTLTCSSWLSPGATNQAAWFDLPFTQWSGTFGDDETLTAAMQDRLLHHAYIVQISGQSYRLKDKLKSGQLKKQAQTELSE